MCKQAFLQILAGVAHLHELGFANRDIKLQNIFVNDVGKIVMADFGFGSMLQGSEQSGLLKTRLGTALYMPPEIFNGQRYKGIPVDIYSLGVTLFAMRSVSYPFEQF